MAKAQFPIDGKLGKDFKATSLMGMRIHPVTKQKKHHNGTDIWSPHEPCWIEAPYDAKVIFAGPSKLKKKDGEPDGFGYYVQLLMKIDGQYYVSNFCHMQKGSIKVKAGQKIEAGTPLGKMGTSGMSTGKHLHWELQLGKKYVWNGTGKNYIEPIGFFKALIAKEKAIASAPVTAKETDPVAPAPTHDEAGTQVVDAVLAAKKAEDKAVVAKPAAAKPAKPKLVGELKKGSKGLTTEYLQGKLGVKGDTLGTFGDNTHKAVVALQKKHGLKADGIVGPLTWKALG